MIIIPIIVVISIFILAWWWNKNTMHQWKTPKKEFPKDWRLILIQNVAFYNALSSEEKDQFEYRVQEFLLNCRVTGIKTKIKDIDRVLIGASAIIPIFNFPHWRYNNIDEVLVYPGSFNKKFQTEGPNRNILGMVGSGYMEGKMILSQKALHHGFRNKSDKKNTAIHEFVHLIDKTDGSIDGIPELLLDNQYLLPWIDLINQKIEEIYEGDSDINPYGATNQAEFFSVISEYFFERPQLLEKNHPELYKLLEQVFNQDMAAKTLKKTSSRIGRNDPCPCGSGRKFKRCCGK